MQRPSSAIESTTTRISIEVWGLKSFLGFCFALPYFIIFYFIFYFCRVKELIVIDRSVVVAFLARLVPWIWAMNLPAESEGSSSFLGLLNALLRSGMGLKAEGFSLLVWMSWKICGHQQVLEIFLDFSFLLYWYWSWVFGECKWTCNKCFKSIVNA